MAAAVSYRPANVACTKRSPIHSPSLCATHEHINPACVASPEDAFAMNVKRRHNRGEERPHSPDVKYRRRDDARVVSRNASRNKREIVRYRRDEESQESKRRTHADVHRVSRPDKSKRKSDDYCRRDSSTSSRSSFGRSRPARVGDEHAARHEDALGTAKIKEREREQDTTRRRSRSGRERRRAPPDPCTAPQQQLPVAAVPKHRTVSLDSRPLQEYTESFEEALLRRREIEKMREETRWEMDKVVQTVYFNDPYISLSDLFKP